MSPPRLNERRAGSAAAASGAGRAGPAGQLPLADPAPTPARGSRFARQWMSRPARWVWIVQLSLFVVVIICLPVSDPTARRWLDGIVQPTVVLASAALTSIIWWRAATRGQGLPWGLVSLALAALGLAGLWSAFAGPDPSGLRPDTGDAFAYAVVIPLIYAAAWLLVRSRTPRWSPSLFWDGVIVATGAFAVTATFLTLALPIALAGEASAVVAVAFPLGTFVLAAELAWMAGVTTAHTRQALLWLGLGVSLLAVAGSIQLLRWGLSPRLETSALDVGLLLGVVCLGMASLGGQDQAAQERRLVLPSTAQRVAMPVALVSASVAIAAAAVTTSAGAWRGGIPAVACLSVALARLGLLAWSNTPDGGWALARHTEPPSTTDDLTGLANRRAVSAALAGRRGGGLQPWWGGRADRLSLLVVDLDRFKEVNEALGHAAGDRLLTQVGARLSGVLRVDQMLARLGGDEFAVLLPAVGAEAAVRVAQALRAGLDDPFFVDGEPVYVRASVGVATARLPADGTEDLLRRADVAMYRAKGMSPGVAVFDPRQDHMAGPDRLRRIDELRAALARGDLEVYLQPQVHLSSGALVGAEALARWSHPEHGVLLPGAFLPLAAETGLLPPLTRLLVDRALDACARWWRQGYEIPVSVNLTADDLADEPTRSHVAQALLDRGLPGRALQVEITEQVLLTEPERTAVLLEEWRSAGVAVSIDDYGTGYSSLAYLRELPVDEVKLDRVFAADLRRRTTTTIVRHTVAMAHGLELRVIAEGVEDAASARALTQLHCDIGQGNYFAAAMTVEDFLTRLTSR